MIKKHFVSACLGLAFLLLGFAAWQYPGGSQADPTSEGFSMTGNYLCNLFDTNGINGQPNPGRLWAFVGMFFMCVGFGAFFYRMSARIQHRTSAFIIRYCGLLSMFFAFWVITPYHDIVISIAVTFAMLALFYLSVFVIKSLGWFYKILTAVCLVLLYFNAFIYYTSLWLQILPIAQKIQYVFLLVWVLALDYCTTRGDFSEISKKTNLAR